jgi:hypothetical protein
MTQKSGTAALAYGLLVLIFLYGCAGAPPPGNGASAPASGASTASAPAGVNGGAAKPAWVDSPDAVYSRNAYVAGVGFGKDRASAEQSALAALSSIFRQSLQADQTISSSYQEAVKNGVTVNWTENTSVENAIKTSTAMELVGAEIRDTWSDGGAFYAVAVMEKERTARLYTQMVQDNRRIIGALVDIPAAGRNSMDSLARFQFAGVVAEANQIFSTVLSVIGAPVPAGIQSPEDYRLEAANIIKNIPVSVSVGNDRDNRIRGAFASALSSAGFRTGGNNSRYRLQAWISLTELELPNQTNKFVRYSVEGNFVDTTTANILFPYSIVGREGHQILSEAENRALRAAENKIREEYTQFLSAYLSQLIPKK